MARASDDRSVKGLGSEIASLVLAYAKQETVDPLKALGRYVAWGMAGAVLLSIGAVLGVLGVVRVLQTEAAPHLNGNLTWVPYTGGLLVAVLIAGLAALWILRSPR